MYLRVYSLVLPMLILSTRTGPRQEHENYTRGASKLENEAAEGFHGIAHLESAAEKYARAQKGVSIVAAFHALQCLRNTLHEPASVDGETDHQTPVAERCIGG